MIRLRPPSSSEIDVLLRQARASSFSYAQVGAVGGAAPHGYDLDRNALIVGRGPEDFARARDALRSWIPFRIAWLRSHAEGPPAPGVQVAVVARVLGLWWINISRIVEVIDEPDCFSFSYGTLPRHCEQGEERFQVRLDADGSVEYELRAFSRPRHPLARLARPLARAAQRRFARDSLRAVHDALRQPAPL